MIWFLRSQSVLLRFVHVKDVVPVAASLVRHFTARHHHVCAEIQRHIGVYACAGAYVDPPIIGYHLEAAVPETDDGVLAIRLQVRCEGHGRINIPAVMDLIADSVYQYMIEYLMHHDTSMDLGFYCSRRSLSDDPVLEKLILRYGIPSTGCDEGIGRFKSASYHDRAPVRDRKTMKKLERCSVRRTARSKDYWDDLHAWHAGSVCDEYPSTSRSSMMLAEFQRETITTHLKNRTKCCSHPIRVEWADDGWEEVD